MSSLHERARELYGLTPAEFTAARNASAKEARAGGDRSLAEQLQRLRKPTTAGWVLNLLVRRDPEQVEEVLSLGAQLRAAQGVLTGDELRALDGARRRLTRAVTDGARTLARDAGHPVGDQVAAAVEESLRAAMADAGAGAALTSGLLTDAFTSTGLDPVELEGLVAVPSVMPPTTGAAARATRVPAQSPSDEERPDEEPSDEGGSPGEPAPDPARLAAAREAVDEAHRTVDAARRRAEDASRSVEEVRAEGKALAERRADLRRQLREVDDALEAVTTSREAAERALDDVEDQARTASDAARRAEAELAALAPAEDHGGGGAR